MRMEIRRMLATDRNSVLGVWLGSVEATHTFVPSEDIQAMIPQVRDYLASDETEFWVLVSESGAINGFMGIRSRELEALFLVPEFHRRGGGRLMVERARALYGELRVDVNEQNVAACRFYESCGFIREGRSELDHQGRPYPLLHLRLPGRADDGKQAPDPGLTAGAHRSDRHTRGDAGSGQTSDRSARPPDEPAAD